MNKLFSFTAGLIMVWIIGYLLIVGRSLLIPFLLAIFIWYLLNSISQGLRRIPRFGYYIPTWLSLTLAICLVFFLSLVFINIITANINDFVAVSSRYQEKLTKIFNVLDDRFHLKAMYKGDFIKTLSIQSILVDIYNVFSTITSSAVLIALYVIFLFAEQLFFRQKLDALFPHPEHQQLVSNILYHIVKDTQTYLGIKTLLSVATGVATWLLLHFAGLDFAELWALLTFFLNFIPNIGAILATVFPATLALLQFHSWVPFVIVFFGLISIHLIIGNLIEPRFLGKSLNLSPLVILFSLALWGAIWGILGMFLSVPITVMMLITFAHFESTRPFAVLLSQDGYVNRSYQQL